VTGADADQASAAVLNICAADLGGEQCANALETCTKRLKDWGASRRSPGPEGRQRAIIFLRIAAGLEDPKRGRRAAIAEPHTVMGP